MYFRAASAGYAFVNFIAAKTACLFQNACAPDLPQILIVRSLDPASLHYLGYGSRIEPCGTAMS